MKCPFKKEYVGLSPDRKKEDFRDCDANHCMAYNKDNETCNLCSHERIFNIKVKE
jgi:hypothetical protein